jgi:HSP20 family protein
MMNALTTQHRRDPFRELSTLQREVDRIFGDALGGSRSPATAGAWAPALDVEETEDAFTLYIELPGVSIDDVDVSLEENVLTIEGERRFYAERQDDAFRRVERAFGRFHRAVRLPDRVDPEHVTATHRDGVLTIEVPKAEEAKPRRISISAG